MLLTLLTLLTLSGAPASADHEFTGDPISDYYLRGNVRWFQADGGYGETDPAAGTWFFDDVGTWRDNRFGGDAGLWIDHMSMEGTTREATACGERHLLLGDHFLGEGSGYLRVYDEAIEDYRDITLSDIIIEAHTTGGSLTGELRSPASGMTHTGTIPGISSTRAWQRTPDRTDATRADSG